MIKLTTVSTLICHQHFVYSDKTTLRNLHPPTEWINLPACYHVEIFDFNQPKLVSGFAVSHSRLFLNPSPHYNKPCNAFQMVFKGILHLKQEWISGLLEVKMIKDLDLYSLFGDCFSCSRRAGSCLKTNLWVDIGTALSKSPYMIIVTKTSWNNGTSFVTLNLFAEMEKQVLVLTSDKFGWRIVLHNVAL